MLNVGDAMKLTAIIALFLWAAFLVFVLINAYARMRQQTRREDAERAAWEAVRKELQGDVDEN